MAVKRNKGKGRGRQGRKQGLRGKQELRQNEEPGQDERPRQKTQQAQHQEPRQEEPRRSFLSRLVMALGGLVALEMGWIGGSFLRPRDPHPAGGEDFGIVVAGPVELFAPGTVTAFRAGKFYLSRLDAGGFLALHRKCTHLGCTVPWIEDERRFACPCHASAFDARGDVLSPPAARALDWFAVRIENGIVKVDTSRPLRRDSFHPAQVTRA